VKTYICVALGGALLAMAVTPLVARLSRRLRVMDQPGPRKVHTTAVPRLGGVSLVIVTVVMVAAAMALDNRIGDALRHVGTPLEVLAVTALAVFAVGLIDDIRGLGVGSRLAVEFAAAIVLAACGVRIDSISVGQWGTVTFGWMAWPLTVFWIVGVTNAVNLIDGLDGLAAGISAVACGVVAALAIASGNIVMAVLMLALLGGLTGFLVFNFHPARIFLGDCGSIFLGFVLAASSVLCATKTATLVGLGLPALALGIPIFDTLFSIVRRALERRSVFSPDRGHIHHRLLAMGLRQRHVVILMYGVTLAATGLGMFMVAARDAASLAVFAGILVLLILLFRLVGIVRLRRTLITISHHAVLAYRAAGDRRRLDQAAMRMQEATSFEAWWTQVGGAAEAMRLSRVLLGLHNRDGSRRTLVWQRLDGRFAGSALHVTVPLRARRQGDQLEMRVDVPIVESAEEAGRRLILFARLMDEQGLAAMAPAPRPRDNAARWITPGGAESVFCVAAARMELEASYVEN
jgi:UDP-N-acetylmuramyl pentapeptide phosphotransferase/UDP-N-acetylglucosamine-1-phosphate transferase